MKTGWHFTRVGGWLGNNDPRQVSVGETLTVDGELQTGEHGLHFSERVIDALRYAPGSQLWRVEGSAELLGHGICCGYSRTALEDYGDVLSLIVEFASWCACRARDHVRAAEASYPDARAAAYYDASPAVEDARAAQAATAEAQKSLDELNPGCARAGRHRPPPCVRIGQHLGRTAKAGGPPHRHRR